MHAARFFSGTFLAAGILFLSLTAAVGQGPFPAPDATPPPPSAEAKALAAQIVAAPDDAAREKLLANAPPALAGSLPLLIALYETADDARQEGKLALAESALAFAVTLAEKLHEPVYAHLAELARAKSEVTRGDDAAAMPRFERCRAFFKKGDTPVRLASTLTGQAIVYLHRTDYRAALANLRQAHDIYVAAGNKSGILSTLNTTANIFGDQGQAARATEYQQQALALAGDDPFWLTALYHNIASVYISQADFPNAIKYMEKSAALAENRDDQPSLGSDLASLGELYQRDGRTAEADHALRRALKIAETTDAKSMQSDCLDGLAAMAFARGGSSNLFAAMPLAERALATGRESGSTTSLWHANVTLGKIRRALGDLPGARTAFREAIAIIEETRGHLTGGDQDATTFLADKVEPYQELVALLVQENHPAEALAMAENAKARVLVEVLSSSKSDPAREMTDAERATIEKAGDEIADLNRQIAAAKAASPNAPPAQFVDLETKLAAARRDRDRAESDFFIAHPDLRTRRPPRADDSALSNSVLNALLDDGGTVLVEYVVADEEAFVFTVAKAKNAASDAAPEVRAERIPLGRKALQERATAFRAALADRSLAWQASAGSLGKELLGPAWPACADAQRLIIVADGPLWDVPFQALSVEKLERAIVVRTHWEAESVSDKPTISKLTKLSVSRTLWEAKGVSYAPSLTFLARSAELVAASPAPPSASLARLLAIGNPSLAEAPSPATAAKPDPAASVLMDSETVPLPDAERQVAALAKLYGPDNSKVLIGADAQEDAFKQLAGSYDILHFATHGFLNDTAPMYSRLLMAQTGLSPDEDGFLEAWEWLPLKLHARLAVLSACETGRGRVGEGEGVLGLSWALFSAGCPAVVVSQWKVDSASTTDLMVAFHKALLAGSPPANALRTAALDLAKNPKYRHPFYWAPFVLVGADSLPRR